MSSSSLATEPVPVLSRVAAVRLDQPSAAVELVAALLDEAREARASDVHLQPTPDGLEIHLRVDGVLARGGILPTRLAANVVGRLKVLADLLTYRTDIPQEGRVRDRTAPGAGEIRVSTFPTLHGERAAIRLFASPGERLRLADLGLPGDVHAALIRHLGATSGAILLTGPAGTGKTTTIYACLRELVAASHGGRSLATLEDPIEAAVAGVSQAQVNLAAGFDLATGLRSLLRQDPEVIAVGEIRDRTTAEVAFQASLTGHLVLTTFHAGTAAGALSRLREMGIEPYLIRSGLVAVVSQRLIRTLCSCARPATAEDDQPSARLGLPVAAARVAVGCAACLGSGYRGRMVIAEWLGPAQLPGDALTAARADLASLEASAAGSGMIRLWDRALQAVTAGHTTPTEVRRVLGFNDPASAPAGTTHGE